MRHVLVLSLLVVLLLPLTACDTVTTKHPIGKPVTEDLLDELDGVWQVADPKVTGSETMRAQWLGNGRVRTMNLIQREGKEDEPEILRVTELESDQWGPERFAHIHVSPADQERSEWGFVRLTIAEDVLLVAIPRADAFAEAVKSGELPGRIESDHYSKTIHLTADRDALHEFITSHPIQDLFMVEEPGIFTRRNDNGRRAQENPAPDRGN